MMCEPHKVPIMEYRSKELAPYPHCTCFVFVNFGGGNWEVNCDCFSLSDFVKSAVSAAQ
jgi:hypothetical protein